MELRGKASHMASGHIKPSMPYGSNSAIRVREKRYTDLSHFLRLMAGCVSRVGEMRGALGRVI